MSTTYYDTTKVVPPFAEWRLLAEGTANWDFFVHPIYRVQGAPWVLSVAKVYDCKTSSYGNLSYFKHMRSLYPQWFTVLTTGEPTAKRRGNHGHPTEFLA